MEKFDRRARSVLTRLTRVLVVVLLAFVNLKGVKESGKIFAAPTYAFILIMGVLLLTGAVKALGGNLHPQHLADLKGTVPFKQNALGQGLFYGVGLYVVLHAFASGGAAVTGVEAISNGVTAFRKPEWKNARVTLIIMGATLGTLFFGLSALATKVHPIPYESGSPTVISQIGKFVFGGGLVGNTLYYVLQAGTMLILVLAANTSFADFPRLASFHAGDNFMPKQLTTRGHRLVFSNGIISLAAAAVVLLVATGAKVDRLIPLYAIGVFTSFTMSQAGMAKHHVKKKEPGWRKGLFVNATGAVLSLIVDAIILVTKFAHGAWVIVVIVPLMVAGLVRLNRQYQAEAEELEQDAPAAAAAPILRRHNVLVLVDSLDVASARAIQYARTLTPDDLRALHFALDPTKAGHLREEWSRLGLTRLPLDIVECPDRRITRAAAEAVAADLAGGDTEVSVLIPRRRYRRAWHQLLHDRTADSIADALAGIAHCNVTIVPYVLGSRGAAQIEDGVLAEASARTISGPRGAAPRRSGDDDGAYAQVPPGCSPIADIRYRRPAKVGGRVRTQRVRPWSGVATLECTLVDGTGAITVVFLGRRHVPGIDLGTHMVVEGTVGQHGGRLAILNPVYELFTD